MESFFCGKRRGGVTGFMFLWLAAGAMAVGQSGPTESPPGQAAPGTAAPGPQLELSITGPQKAAVGDRVTFELVVTNVGKSPAAKLLAIDDFDPGLSHAAADAGPIEHDLKDLRPGESQRLNLTFRVTQPGKLSHQVRILRDGKAIAGLRSSLTAEGKEPVAEAKEPASGPKELSRKAPSLFGEGPPKMAAKSEAATMNSDDDFPEITPRSAPPEEEKLPDLGSPLVDAPENLKRLHEKYPVWIDGKEKNVVVLGVVCQRRVPLELFACLRGSKEHEAVVSVPTKAAFVHAALLAVGAEAGAPVQFRPKYVPASGSVVEITCVWKDAQGKRQTMRAQDWVRNAKTGKAMELPWVFGGSRFLKDPDTGKEYYQADGDGDLICVSNFPGAMLDLPIESTSSDTSLLFEAFTEHIPPRGTPVTLILSPKPKPSGEKAPGKPAAGPHQPASPAAEKK